MGDSQLLDEFVRAFEKLDDLSSFGAIPPELDDGMDDSQWARPKWKPAAIVADPTALSDLYMRLPERLPPLYEQLLLSYRWLEIELGGMLRLLPNPPGPSLAGLFSAIVSDRALAEVLFPLGLIQFGKAPGDNYDPICFDTRRRHADGDTPIIRIEHEAILCDGQLGKSWEVAPSFRTFVESVVAKASDS